MLVSDLDAVNWLWPHMVLPEVIQKSDNLSSQMQLLRATPCIMYFVNLVQLGPLNQRRKNLKSASDCELALKIAFMGRLNYVTLYNGLNQYLEAQSMRRFIARSGKFLYKDPRLSTF